MNNYKNINALNNYSYSISWSDFTQQSSRPTTEDEDAQIHPEISFANFKLGKDRGVTIDEVDVYAH